jgi:hypothetical protein
VYFYVDPFTAVIEQVFSHSGSVIMSAVYSYKAERRHDHMIERATKALELSMKEMRPEVVAIFSAFPSRKALRPSLPAVADRLIRSPPPPLLDAWHAPQESVTFGEKTDVRKYGKSICVHAAWSGETHVM